MGCLLLGGRGRLTSAAHRRKVVELIGEANAAGAGLVSPCVEIGICLRTLKRWRKAFLGDGDGLDARATLARMAVAFKAVWKLPNINRVSASRRPP